MSEESRLRIVIVGGVAGGASAAARARRCHADAEITILEKGPAASFANCGLPYHIGGEIEEREKLIVASADLFWNRFRIRVRTGHEVTQIDRDAKTISGRRLEPSKDGDPDFKLPYDKLILSTGSQPIQPSFWRDGCENLFQLWTLTDMDDMLAYMKRRPSKKATVVGAGFVGLELVEQLQRRGIQVTLVERLDQVCKPLDEEMARLLETQMAKAGANLQLDASVSELLINNNRATALKLENGDTITTDLVVACVGVRPRVDLAESAELEIGDSGGVVVNDYCQTSDPDVYAVGDMVEYQHLLLGRNACVPLAGPANRSGRVAGAHSVGYPTRPMSAVQGTAIVRVFDSVAAFTGLNESDCRQAGIEFRSAIIQAPHHASYFPNARTMALKILYAEDGKLLGAQAVGQAGVDKRIDVVATVLKMGGSVHDLAELDLCYAPPFGSAKDPIHMAAFVAQNDLASAPRLVDCHANVEGMQVVDVRNASEFEKLPALAGAIQIPVDELHERFAELDPNKPTVTVCHSGKRSHVAACLLLGKGFSNIRNMSGGMSIRRLVDPA